MNTNNDNISIKDNNSQILSIVPKEWREALVIISKVKQYDSVDSYVLEMIRDRLAMFADSRDDLGEDFQDYMKDIEGLEDTDSKEKYVEVKVDSDLVERLKKIEERKKQKQQLEKESNSNNDDGYKKFIKDVNKSTAIIEFPSKEEVENRFGKVPPDDDKEKEDLK